MFYISYMVTTKKNLQQVHKRQIEKNLSIPLQKIIKSPCKRAREEERRKGNKTARKQLTKRQYIPINNYFKCKWTKCSSQKTQSGEWINKQDQSICCLQETLHRSRDTHRLKVKGWKEIFHASAKEKKAEVAIHITGKMDFKMKTIMRDKEGHYIKIKGSIQE